MLSEGGENLNLDFSLFALGLGVLGFSFWWKNEEKFKPMALIFLKS